MNTKVLSGLTAFLFLLACAGMKAQQLKTVAAKNNNSYPDVFFVAQNDYDRLFLHKANEQLTTKTNKYLDKAIVKINTKNGDMKFLKLKLSYFKNAFLMIQVNGNSSIKVFIMSDDKSAFYKGHFESYNLVMNKCKEDDIINE